MQLKKCENGHFYNGDKYKQCPHCGLSKIQKNVTVDLNEAKGTEILFEETNSMNNSNFDNVLPKSEQKSFLQDDERTVFVYEAEKVVGWLVCVEGEHYGEDFRLKAGKNYIGRGRDMDIVLDKSRTVSRYQHAVISYENKEFRLSFCDSQKEIKLNGEKVIDSHLLSYFDFIKIGSVSLIFIPFCSEKFDWDMSIASLYFSSIKDVK